MKNRSSTKKGFSLIELLVVLAAMGVLTVLSLPSIMHSSETRTLDNTARDVLASLHKAKLQAAVTNINHRVRFIDEYGERTYVIEREETSGQWEIIPRSLPKTIPSQYNVSVFFPDQTVVFLPFGLIANFSGEQNSIIFQSEKLNDYIQKDQRVLKVYAGGAIHYLESMSN